MAAPAAFGYKGGGLRRDGAYGALSRGDNAGFESAGGGRRIAPYCGAAAWSSTSSARQGASS